jgi:arylsulfatase A-like enzyme
VLIMAVITSRKQSPKEDWLGYVVTASARSKIRHALRESERATAEDGKERLRKWMRREGLDFITANLEQLTRRLKQDSPHELYYRLATEVDAACGKVLAELKAQGQLENTLVIFTTDNGYFHAEHGLADKWYPHQESIRVPLIVRDPRMLAAKQGRTDASLTLNADLAPTILAAAGLKVPETMQGRDFAPLYLAEAAPPAWRTEYFYEHGVVKAKDVIPASEALVRKDWKYMLWPDYGTEQLFDLTADPLEESDLAASPAHAARLAEMRAQFALLKAAAK